MPNKEPYKMYPGKHSEVNPGNFKGSEVKKYAAFNMHLDDFDDAYIGYEGRLRLGMVKEDIVEKIQVKTL